MIEKLNIAALLPELILLVMAMVIAMIDLFDTSVRRHNTYVLTLMTLGLVAVLQAFDASEGATIYSFGNMVVSDPMGNWLKCFSTLSVMVTLVYGRPYAAERDMLRMGGELFTLGLFALVGMYVMISGNNFLVLYLGVELLALASYALVALRRDNATASEAAMKYFVLGALGSGFLLYGMSLLYGATGHRASPYDGVLLIDQQPDAHQLDPKSLQWNDHSFTIDLLSYVITYTCPPNVALRNIRWFVVSFMNFYL